MIYPIDWSAVADEYDDYGLDITEGTVLWTYRWLVATVVVVLALIVAALARRRI